MSRVTTKHTEQKTDERDERKKKNEKLMKVTFTVKFSSILVWFGG